MLNRSCEMSESELRPRVFVAGVIQPGDIVLTTTPERLSQRIRKVTGSNISHAMICVGKSSVIDSTGEGVHARNLERLILEPSCAGYVLRPVNPLTTDQLISVISFVRAEVGTRYTMAGAAKSVLAGFVAALTMLTQPPVHDVGVDAVFESDGCNRGASLAALTNSLEFELGAVKPAPGDFGASLARHGVHDLHRAHYRRGSAYAQDVLPGRIHSSGGF
jgi:hypothetical protein